jgi:hypothetical protein
VSTGKNVSVPNFSQLSFSGRDNLLYRQHPIPSFRALISQRPLFEAGDPFSHPSGSSASSQLLFFFFFY